MRKSLNLLVGVFLFVLVFSFSGFRTFAGQTSFNSHTDLYNVQSYFIYINLFTSGSYNPMPSINLSNIFDDSIPQSDLYRVSITSNASVQVSKTNLALPHFTIVSHIGNTDYVLNNFGQRNATTTFTSSNTFDIFISRDVGSISPYFYGMLDCVDQNYTSNISIDLNLTVNSITPLSDSEIDQYEAGYNAGYSVGLEEGTNAGYSSGYNDGYSQGQSSGYNSGFQAGVDSVDTQSYYDSGYQAGQASGYSTGYEQGYDTGYQEAMSRIDSWGADTTNYPVLIYDVGLDDGRIDFLAYNDGYATFEEVNENNFYKYSFTADYFGSNTLINTYDNLNPNHIYKIVLTDYYTSLNGSGYFYLDIGSKSFKFAERDSDYKTDIFVFSEGSNLGSSISFRVEGIARYNNTGYSSNYVYFNKLQIYDYGPIGDTQNHIANQTDDLTNGYDSSAGESASNTFANDASSYELAESNIFTSAKDDLNNFQFYDIGSNSSVLVGLSFVSSMMTAIFGAMGGMTGGPGIVLSVLFSVMLVSIVIGTYRYFVSSGETDNSSSGKTGRYSSGKTGRYSSGKTGKSSSRKGCKG